MSVFSRSTAIVIGPTPPGTGEIAEAISLTPSKSTSPARVPSSRRLMPTSMTTAPSLTQSALTRFAPPAAAIMTSADFVFSVMFLVQTLQHLVLGT